MKQGDALILALTIGLVGGLLLGAAVAKSAPSPAPGPVNDTVPYYKFIDLYRDYVHNTAQLKNFINFYECLYETGFTNGSTFEGYYSCPPVNLTGRPLAPAIRFRWGA